MKRIFFLITLLIAFSSLSSAQDWPGLKIFKDENTRIGLPKKNESRVVFMGNSIFESWIKVSPEFFNGKSYVNRGISGQTTAQMLVRFRQDVIALKPKIVVLLAGTNDIAGNTGPSTLEMIMDNINSMAEIAKANKIKLILCSVLPAFKYKWVPDAKPAEKIKSLDSMIKTYATKNKILYVDFYTPMVNESGGLKEAYTKDGVHPNLEGYKVMEPILEKVIINLKD